jgi:hypothetical protein
VGSSLPQTAQELSQAGMELMGGLVSGRLFHPRELALTAMRAVAASAGVAGLLPCCSVALRWLELSNQLTAYRLFVSADKLLGDCGSLPAALKRLHGADPYMRLWTLEGLGWCWFQDAGRRLDSRLASYQLVPLHTGAGLALARSTLETPGLDRSDCDLRAALHRFRQGCQAISIPGYEGATFEALGLVAATVYPGLAARIEAALSDTGEIAYFWHGMGRGLYFSPLSLLPLDGARRRLIELSQRAPSSCEGRENMLSGLGWATALVNVRHPEVVAFAFRTLAEGDVPREAFEMGAASALVIWRENDPGNSWLRRWDSVAAPLQKALAWHEMVRARGLWGRLFRVHGLRR